MKNQIYRIKEFFKELNRTVNPYCIFKDLQESIRDFEKTKLNYRFSVLERLTKKHGRLVLIPLEEFEREAGITETRDDMGNYISCTY